MDNFTSFYISYCSGQGAIGIEARKDRKDLKTIINKITNKIVFDNVLKEKNILNKYGGGCQQKIGVSIYSQNGRTIFSMKGKTNKVMILISMIFLIMVQIKIVKIFHKNYCIHFRMIKIYFNVFKYLIMKK